MDEKSGSCDAEKETIMHVLNSCPRMLDRYKWRHDNMLHIIHDFVVESHKDKSNCEVLCDIVIQNGHLQSEQYKKTVPDDVYLTAERPDLVIVNRSEKRVHC